jgi:DNA-binding response OmpR family regulator
LLVWAGMAASRHPRTQLPRTGRILVIAEEPEVVDTVTEYFTDLDYETHGALAIQGAAAVIDSRLPDVILLDVQMPRLTEILKELRLRCPRVPVLVAAGNAQTARHIRTLGTYACVHKPFVWDALRYRVALAVEAALRARVHPQAV